MRAVYRLNAEELDHQFLASLKSLFKNKKIEIVVSSVDEAAHMTKHNVGVSDAQLIDKDLNQVEIDEVIVDDDSLTIELLDGRTVVAPILWYPRLAYATQSERQHFEIRTNVIYWPVLDEEVSVRSLLLGRKSGESLQSLEKWLAGRETVAVA